MTEEEYTRFNQMFKSMGNDPMMMYRAKSPFENNRDEFNDVLNYAPTENQQTYSIGTDDAGNEILGNTINDFMSQPQPKEEDNSFFANTSWGGDFDAAEVSNRILADEEGGETNLPELIDGGRTDLGQVISDLHDKAKDTSLYAQYMYSAEDWAEKGKEIFDETGMELNPTGNKDVFEKAWNLTKEIKRQKALATDASGHVDMDKVYEAMPYLRDIHEAHGTAAAVMVMQSAKELQTINDVYDNEAERFAASLGYGIKRGALSVVNQYTGAKAMLRGLVSDKGLTAEEINDIRWVANEMQKMPQYSYSSFGSLLGGVMGSAAENAPIMLPEMARTAAVNFGKLTGPYGTAAGAVAYALMSAQIGGAQYIENISKTDENGNPIYTPRQAALLSAAQGLAEGYLEKQSIAAAGKAVFSAGTAKKLSELYTKDAALAAAQGLGQGATKEAAAQAMSSVMRETAREILRERIQHGFKAGILSGAAELEEEFEQQISDMVLENMAQIAFRGGEADVSSVDEILSEAFGAAVEALPAVAGFGFMGAGGSVVADTERVLSMRERFANAKASEIARGIYENEHHQNIVYGVAENLDNVQELQGKAPEIVTEILDSQNETAGMKDSDVNVGMLMQKDGGAEIVNQIAAESGTSQEELQECLNGTGFLTVKTSALQKAIHAMTPEQKTAVAPHIAAIGHMTNQQIADYIKDAKAAFDAVQNKTDKETAETIERFATDSFEDEETRKEAAEIIASDTDNPYEAAKRRIRENQADIDEYLKETAAELEAGMGQGTSTVETVNEQGEVATGRASNNAEWYRNWTADHPGEKITKAEKERIAYENLTGTATRYATADYNNLPQEAVEEMARVKGELDALFAERERLQNIAAALKGFGKSDFLATASMPKETREAYNAIYQILSASPNKKVRDNARVNAILAARMLSRLGFMWKDDAGRAVNVLEILPKIAANAVYNAQEKSALMQEMTRQMDEVRAKYEGTDEWMKAPNGQPTKLTEEQWLTVRTPAFKAWFGDWENDPANASKVVDENGEPKPVHHGTGRADRVGSVFLPERATSGPMAFFTDSFGIASNYAKDKADTSLSREGLAEDIRNQFTVEVKERNGKTKTVTISEYWNYLPLKEKQKIAKRAEAIGYNDDYEIEYMPGNKIGTGGYVQNLREAKGNHLEALVLEWLESGNLYNEEGEFLEVLRLAGLENVTFNDPDYREEAVYSVFMRMDSPFNAAEIPDKIYKALEKAAEKAQSAFNPDAAYNADMWDKTNISPKDWMEKLARDKENETSHAWTVIPDWVTKTLQKKGYDGIQDVGGKYHDQGHTVYIPFASTQIKSATGNNGQFLADDPNIYHQPEIENGDESLAGVFEAITKFFVERANETDVLDRITDDMQMEDVRERLLHTERKELRNAYDYYELMKNSAASKDAQDAAYEMLLLATADIDSKRRVFNNERTIRALGEILGGKITIGEGSTLEADLSGDYLRRAGDYAKRNAGAVNVPGEYNRVEIQTKESRELFEKIRVDIRKREEKARIERNRQRNNEQQDEHADNQGALFNVQNAEWALDMLLQAAWHGSPYIFEKFDLGAIGTGEGAQAHGWGLYFAQDKKVSEGYRDVLAGRSPKYIIHGEERLLSDMGEADGAVYEAALLLREQRSDVEKAIQYADDNYWRFKDTNEQMEVIDLLRKGEVRPADVPTAGSLFQVEIPDDDVLLDEQKMFEEQPEKVREAIKNIIGDMSEQERENFYKSGSLNKSQDINEWDGRDIYHALSVIMGLRNHTFEGREKEASLILNQYGVQGITYEGGRDGRCFVIFDDQAINIIDTYNQRVNGETYRGGFSAIQNLISLFQNADESTFMHEMAHFYLNELQKIAANAGKDSQAAKDVATIYTWAEWHDGDAEAFKGTASASEFAKREKQIKEAQQNGVAVMEDGTTKTLDQLLNEWRQEKFARGFEEYLHEGKAPTSALKRIFMRFAHWLKQIYKDVTGAGVTATPEVEAVFARMIASDEEIETQAAIDRAADISRVDPDLMDTDTAAMRERWAEEAKAEAQDKLRKALLKEQREKDVEEHVKAFEAEERARLTEIPAFMSEALIAEGMPENEAAQLAGFASAEEYREDLNGWGGSYENAVKQSVEAERERYIKEMPNDEHIQELAEEAMLSAEAQARLVALEAEILKRREKRYANAPKRLAKAMEGMEAALDEETEEPLGKALRTLKYSFRWQRQQQEQIEEMQSTIEEMKARIARGDARLADSEQALETAAAQSEAEMEALRENAEAETASLRAKLKAQVKTFKDATMLNAEWLRGVRDAAEGTAKLHREFAKEQLDDMPIKDSTNARRFINEARKAAQDCLKAIANAVRKNNGVKKEDTGERDYEAAKQAKLRQSVYLAEAWEAQKNKRELDKILNGFKRRQKTLSNDKRGEIDASTKYYINHLLYMMGIAKKDAIIPQSLESLDKHFASMKDAWQGENGNNNIGDLDIDFEIPQWMRDLLSTQSKKVVPEDYREYTMDELRDVQTLVNILYKTGRNKNRLLTSDKSLLDVVAEMVEDYNKTVTTTKGEKGISNFFSELLQPIVMLRTLGKTFVEYIYNPLFDGVEARTRMQSEAAESLNALFSKYWDKKTRGQMRDKEIGIQLADGTELTKEKVLVLALNWGNEGNRLRVVNGLTKEGLYYTNEADIEDIFKQTMTAQDWAFVQEVWDYINGFGDKVNDVVEKTTGAPMKRVDPDSFVIKTSDGKFLELRGGYYPIAYDPEKSAAQADADLMTSAKAMGGASVFGTGLGSTKARTETGRQEAPLLLSLDVLFKHVNQQIHIATMRIPCRDAYKVLTNRTVQGMIEQSLGIKAYRSLKRWVEANWQEPRQDGTTVDKVVEHLRRNTVAAIMGYRMSTALLNLANPVYMAREMGALNALSAMVEFYRHPMEYRKWCLEESPFLRNRANNIDRDLNVTADQSFAPKNALQEVIQRTANRAIEETDMLCSLPAYYGTYQNVLNAELEKGAKLEDAKKAAHRAAEDVIRRIFGSSDTLDQSAMQRSKSAITKAFTPFYTFAATQANAVFERYLQGRYQGSRRNVKDDGTIEAVKKNIFERWGAMVSAAAWTYIFGAFAEQLIREAIGKIAGDDDDDLEAFLREWAAASITGASSGVPFAGIVGDAIGREITGKSYPTRSFGIASAAIDRFLDAANATKRFTQGKRDWIDTGRAVSKAVGGAGYGLPDTITDAIFNAARAYNIDASMQEWFRKSLFDKKLKAKGR